MLNGTVGKVVVGKGAVSGDSQDPIHPMEDDRNFIHYIETIWVEDQERDEKRSKKRSGEPDFYFWTFGIMIFLNMPIHEDRWSSKEREVDNKKLQGSFCS